ncbi:hypothetical protein EOM82_05785 [bacterium]|nr:hypothetical protein [bacterium]
MNKQKKTAISTGADNNGNPMYYYCTECGRLNLLSAKRCLGCNAKRPQDAYEHAVMPNSNQSTPDIGFVDRTVRNAAPKPANPCFAVPMPNGQFDKDTYINNGLNNLPTYYSTDEYGRVFKSKVFYGSLPCAGPVPVPTPSKTIQVSTINTPLN